VLQHPSAVAAEHPDRPAVVIGEHVTTYAELDARSNQVANLLASVGVGPDGVVAVMLENRPEYFDLAWGVFRSGAYLVPVNWHLSGAEAALIIADSGAQAVFVSSALATDGVAPDGAHRFSVGGAVDGWGSYEAAVAGQPTTPRADEIEGTYMLYSSGTTGRPKGIRREVADRTIGAPTSFTMLLEHFYGIGPDTVYYSPSPLYHAAPLGWSTGVHRLGGTVVAAERFDAHATLAAIERHRVTLAQFVPTHLIRLLGLSEDERAGYDVSSLRSVVHAAAPCPPDVKRAAIEWLGPIVNEYYSGSEGAGFCAINSEEWLAHPGSVGRSLLGPVHIVGDDGTELPAGETGQVWFEGAPRFEYLHDPAKTAEVIDGRGWTTLGDVGHVDADGFLYLSDRVSNMIITGGVNVYPREVEDVLLAHPAVEDVAVIGVADDDMGEAVRAVVQLRDGAEPGPALEADLIEFCRARLTHFKCPRSVVVVDQLPRLPTGKLLRRMLPPEVFA